MMEKGCLPPEYQGKSLSDIDINIDPTLEYPEEDETYSKLFEPF